MYELTNQGMGERETGGERQWEDSVRFSTHCISFHLPCTDCTRHKLQCLHFIRALVRQCLSHLNLLVLNVPAFPYRCRKFSGSYTCLYCHIPNCKHVCASHNLPVVTAHAIVLTAVTCHPGSTGCTYLPWICAAHVRPVYTDQWPYYKHLQNRCNSCIFFQLSCICNIFY